MCDLQQRAAIGKWSTVMRTLSAEWSCWAVQVCLGVCVRVPRVRAHSFEYHKVHDVHACACFLWVPSCVKGRAGALEDLDA